MSGGDIDFSYAEVRRDLLERITRHDPMEYTIAKWNSTVNRLVSPKKYAVSSPLKRSRSEDDEAEAEDKDLAPTPSKLPRNPSTDLREEEEGEEDEDIAILKAAGCNEKYVEIFRTSRKVVEAYVAEVQKESHSVVARWLAEYSEGIKTPKDKTEPGEQLEVKFEKGLNLTVGT